jgi:hypothetical protein
MGEAIYSVSWRIMRTSIEYSYVSIPVADDMIKLDADGNRRIDVERMGQRAIEMGQLPTVEWYPESQRIELHPLQNAPGPGEKRH